MEPAEIIARARIPFVPGRAYHQELPAELAPWYGYHPTEGHSLVVLIRGAFDSGGDPADFVVPAPVRSVLRAGWELTANNVPVAALNYDPALGLVVDDSDLEVVEPLHPGVPHKYVVGELFQPGVTHYSEGMVAGLHRDHATVVIFFDAPTDSEIREVRRGALTYGWLDGGAVALLLARFGTLPWQEAPFEILRVPEDQRSIPGTVGLDLPVDITLVDSATGVIRGLRRTAAPAAFADQVRGTVQRMVLGPPSSTDAQRALQQLYRSSTDELARRAITST